MQRGRPQFGPPSFVLRRSSCSGIGTRRHVWASRSEPARAASVDVQPEIFHLLRRQQRFPRRHSLVQSAVCDCRDEHVVRHAALGAHRVTKVRGNSAAHRIDTMTPVAIHGKHLPPFVFLRRYEKMIRPSTRRSSLLRRISGGLLASVGRSCGSGSGWGRRRGRRCRGPGRRRCAGSGVRRIARDVPRRAAVRMMDRVMRRCRCHLRAGR
jgi:hypothetical protein